VKHSMAWHGMAWDMQALVGLLWPGMPCCGNGQHTMECMCRDGATWHGMACLVSGHVPWRHRIISFHCVCRWAGVEPLQLGDEVACVPSCVWLFMFIAHSNHLQAWSPCSWATKWPPAMHPQIAAVR